MPLVIACSKSQSCGNSASEEPFEPETWAILIGA